MLNENILNEMEQRPQEKTGKFLTRQQMARNTIRRINALEVHLGHLLADHEVKSKIGGSIKGGGANNRYENRTEATEEAKESIRTIT